MRDSKVLTEAERELLFDRVAAWCDRLGGRRRIAGGVRRAGHGGGPDGSPRERAIEGLGVTPDAAVVDGKWDFVGAARGPRRAADQGRPAPACRSPRRASSPRSPATGSCASRPSTTRNWSFDSNKGYPCPLHKAALQGYGPSAIHRRTWVFMDHYVPWPGVPRRIIAEQATLF